MTEALPKVRIDKWLWAVRVYKSRGLAAEACRMGRVAVGEQPVKASRELRLDEIVTAKVGLITRTLKVRGLLERRVGAALVKDYAEDLTPPAEYEKLKEMNRSPVAFRPKGAGRPTKRDRRILESFFGTTDKRAE
jgi:ribosome-associated heat shock protein Hsp15